MLSNNKFPGKCWYGRYPWIRLAVECEKLVEKWINFIFCLGTPMIYLAWKVFGTTRSFSLTRKACLSKYFYLLFFCFELWHLYKSLLPSAKGQSILIMQFLFFWVSIFSYKAPTKGHYDHTWALDVANMRVCFMNGSMIEYDGLGITFFSVDILKDMVACWYAWVLKSSCQN
jgi:hypothetical protein